MIIRFFYIFFSCLCTTVLYAQSQPPSAVQPILIDRTALSGIGLQKVDITDEPEKDFYQKTIYRGESLSVYIVSTETWNNKMNDFPFDEFVYMLHGQAIVKPRGGISQVFNSGDFFFAPKGFTGEWEIRAGNNLHYELSIIASKRSSMDSSYTRRAHHLFDRSTLSGEHIDLDNEENYSELLRKGIELTVSLESEKPVQYPIEEPMGERVIHLLSGQITLVDAQGKSTVFYSGDFFIIPQGFIGQWQSAGHGLVKYLSVERTE